MQGAQTRGEYNAPLRGTVPSWCTITARACAVRASRCYAARASPVHDDAMNQENAINRLVDQLARNLPGSVAAAREEFTAAARAVLSDAFSRMELVTREEFDAQARVLARSREQLEALARELQDLELRLAQLEDKRS